VALTL